MAKRKEYSLEEGLLLLISIVPRNKAAFFIDFLEQYHVNLQLDFVGEGTAPDTLLNQIKTNNDEKKIIFSIINSYEEKEIIEKLYQKFKKNRNYNGIAFTVKLSSIIGVYAYQFLGDIRIGKGQN